MVAGNLRDGQRHLVGNGRLSNGRDSIVSASLAQLQAQHLGWFLGLAPEDLEIDLAQTVALCEHAVRVLGIRGIDIEPAIRKRGGPSHVDNLALDPI